MTASDPSREYVYGGSALLAKIDSSGTRYYHPDHLSARVSTDSNGNTARTFGHFPFGELWYETGTASKWKFASYERDAETGLDHTWFRPYSSSLGRWMHPDPAGLASVNPANPQSWNRYAFVFNDPLNLVDPLGLCPDGTICVDVWAPFWPGGLGGLGTGGPIHQPLLDVPDLGGGGGGNSSPTWAAIKTFFTRPNTGPGSCIALFKDTATAPLKQVATAAQKYVPLIISATQAAPPSSSLVCAAGQQHD